MDYAEILDISAEVGYRLAISGAEIYRIEESILRIMDSYGVHAEAFVIPNCLIVSIKTDDGTPMTQMRRISHQENNIDAVEKYNSLSRRICAEHPSTKEALEWIKQVDNSRRYYPLIFQLLGYFLAACGFSLLFGANIIESFCAGICGLVCGAFTVFTKKHTINPFFQTIFSGFLITFAAYLFSLTPLSNNTDSVVIGALMLLVPGLLFTNALRDIIHGDTNSGVNRIIQVFLIGIAITLGTGAAWSTFKEFFTETASTVPISYPLLIECIACLIGCIGFSFIFNIYGYGFILCAIGGSLTWMVYSVATAYASDLVAYFCASLFAGVFSEVMARIRKYPAISYLFISIIPLIPGTGVFYTMNYAIRGQIAQFVHQGLYTIAVGGVIAVGILLVYTISRVLAARKH